MTNENKSTLILGFVIGAIVVYLFLKNKQQTQTVTMEQKINILEIQLQQLQQISLTPVAQQPIAQQIIQPETTYKNSEKTNFILNDDGDIIGMETIRDAKIR